MNRLLTNLRHLAAFREVAHGHSVCAASKQVHLSQPAVTQAIGKLERVLGVPLFERRATGMFPTEPGEMFRMRVERALDLIRTGVHLAIQADRRRATAGNQDLHKQLTAVQLRALIAVSKSGNFSLAARQVGVSQPSLHRAATDLERLVGVKLFARSSQGVHLTSAARDLTMHAQLAFAELDQAVMELEEWRGVDSGRIVVGTLPLARSYILPTAINALAQDRPEVCVGVVDGPYNDLLHALRHGDIDLLVGALRNPPPIDDVVEEPLLNDVLAIIGRKGHPLANGQPVEFGDLLRFPWVVPRRGAPTRARFEALFENAGVGCPKSIVESSSLILIRGLLLGSDRLTLLSGHQVGHELRLGELVVLPFDTSSTERAIGFTTRRGWRPTRTQSRFLDRLREAGRSARAL